MDGTRLVDGTLVQKSTSRSIYSSTGQLIALRHKMGVLQGSLRMWPADQTFRYGLRWVDAHHAVADFS
jgi:hypothetical protein